MTWRRPVSEWTLDDYRRHYELRWLQCVALARLNVGTWYEDHYRAAADAVLDRYNQRLRGFVTADTVDA